MSGDLKVLSVAFAVCAALAIGGCNEDKTASKKEEPPAAGAPAEPAKDSSGDLAAKVDAAKEAVKDAASAAAEKVGAATEAAKEAAKDAADAAAVKIEEAKEAAKDAADAAAVKAEAAKEAVKEAAADAKQAVADAVEAAKPADEPAPAPEAAPAAEPAPAPAAEAPAAEPAPAPAAEAPAAESAPAPAAEAPAAAPAPAEETKTAEAAPAAEAPAPAPAAEAPAAAPAASAAPASPENAEVQAAAKEAGLEFKDGRYRDKDGHPVPAVTKDYKVDWATWQGFRRYHDACHVCHGPNALGSTFAPSLADSLKTMDYETFYGIVVGGRVADRGGTKYVMPAFGEDKNIMCYLDDIYTYIKARSLNAEGKGGLPPGRPNGREDISPEAKQRAAECEG